MKQPIQETETASSSTNQNRAAADELRRLLSGKSNPTAGSKIDVSGSDNIDPSMSGRSYVLERLEKRGKIELAQEKEEEASVLFTNTNFSGSAPSMEKGKYHYSPFSSHISQYYDLVSIFD